MGLFGNIGSGIENFLGMPRQAAPPVYTKTIASPVMTPNPVKMPTPVTTPAAYKMPAPVQQNPIMSFAKDVGKVESGVVRGAKDVITNPIGTARQAMVKAAPPVSHFTNRMAGDLTSSTKNVPVVKSLTSKLASPMLRSIAKTQANYGVLASGKSPYKGNAEQKAGQILSDTLNSSMFLPLSDVLKGLQAGYDAARGVDVAADAADTVSKGSKFLAKVIKSTKTNAIYGGGYGMSGSMENKGNLKQVAESTAIGTVGGGLFGASMPVLGAGVGKLFGATVGKGVDRLAENAVIKKLFSGKELDTDTLLHGPETHEGSGVPNQHWSSC